MVAIAMAFAVVILSTAEVLAWLIGPVERSRK